MNDDKDNSQREKNYMSLGTGLGLCFGETLGIIRDSIPIGVVLGLCAGVVIGTVFNLRIKTSNVVYSINLIGEKPLI